MTRILALEILNDIRNGIGDHELMQKYQLSVDGLERVMGRLVAKKAIGHSELREKSPLYRKLADRWASRQFHRARVRHRLRVYHDETSQKGIVRDISKNGLRVAGLNAAIGHVMTLRLPLRELGATEPIEFAAECRWSRIRGRDKQYIVCGFEITHITGTARHRWEELTALLEDESAGSDRLDEPVIDTEMQRGSVAARDRESPPRKFSGRIDDVDILDVVQFLLLIGKNTVLRVISSEGAESRLYLQNGVLVHADLGRLAGEEAFFKCMDWPAGEFLLEPWSDPSDHTIDDPAELLLVEAARRRDESSQ